MTISKPSPHPCQWLRQKENKLCSIKILVLQNVGAHLNLNLSHLRIHAENNVFFVVLELELIEDAYTVIVHCHSRCLSSREDLFQ